MHTSLPLAEQTSPQSMRPFLTIWTGQVCSWFGSALVQFALVWWLTELTGSATVLALSTALSLLPVILIGPFAGALVDRWNRRMVLIVADGAIALATGLLAGLYWVGVAQIWHIYVLMFVRAIGGVFHLPAITASTTLLVPDKHLARVAGVNQSIIGVISFVSPPLGALLLALLPMQIILAIDVATALMAITPLLFFFIPQPALLATKTSFVRTVLADLQGGLRFVWNFQGLRILIGMMMVLNLFGSPLFTLVPILITKHFGSGVVELGWFQSALGIGGITGGFILSVWGGFKRRIITMLLALVFDGIGMAALGLAPASAMLFAAGAWFVVGLMSSLINGASMAILQARVPPSLQGRVFALAWGVVTAMSPLGLAIAGPVADTSGASVWYVVAGLCHAAMGMAAFLVPALMRIEDKASEDRETIDHAATSVEVVSS